MQESSDPKAAVNPAARHDAPHPPAPQREPEERPAEEQVKPAQGEELSPLDPGGISD